MQGHRDWLSKDRDMSWEALFTFALIIIGMIVLLWDLFAPDLVFLGMIAALMAVGILSPAEALAGFSNPEVIAIGALFIVAGAMKNTGALGFFATRIFGRIERPRRSLVKMMLPIASISAFLNNTPIVAMFLPVVVDWARRNRLSPSRFLIPLSYATILGGLCTLIGTSTNLVVSGLMVGAGLPRMSFFELTPVGLPCALVGIGFIAVFAKRLLPDRQELIESLGEHRREYLAEMEVLPDCPFVGQGIEQAGLRHLPGLFLIRIERADEIVAPVGPEERLKVGDRLVFTGVVSTLLDLQKIRGLVPAGDHRDGHVGFFEDNNLCEAVVSEDSPLVGNTIRAANFRTRYGAAVVAVHRGGRRLSGKIGDIVVRPGDTLLLEASPGFLRAYQYSSDFYLVSEVPESAPPRYEKAIPTLIILILLIGVVTAEILPMVTAALLAACVVIVLGCLSVGEMRGSVDMSVLVLIAAALGVSKALEKTGVAASIASVLVESGLSVGPLGVLATVYLATLIFTEFLSNAAAAALVFPVSLEAARQLGVDARPFAIAITVAASAAFASPIGYQTHLMVYGPGGYKFGDFLRIGIPLDFLVFVVAVTVIPFFWPFHP
jgi:di/tricarboxylate transporter